jgi:protein-tyrosine phosphatase
MDRVHRNPPVITDTSSVSYRGRVSTLGGAWNFRDVADSGPVRPGRLFRSSELSRLDDAGRDELRRLAVTDVADLRSPREVARRGPGLVPAGVDVHLLPFPDLAADQAPPDSAAPHEDAFRRLLTSKSDDESPIEAATRYMIDEYRRFPTLAGSRRAVHRVVTLLAAGRPVLAHCFAGKDRTGFVVATVLEAAGVDPDSVMADYLRSNAAVPALRARIVEIVQDRPEAEITPEVVTFTQARLSDEVLGVRAEYLAAAREVIDDTYGSLAGYLDAAAVSADDIAALRAELLG